MVLLCNDENFSQVLLVVAINTQVSTLLGKHWLEVTIELKTWCFGNSLPGKVLS